MKKILIVGAGGQIGSELVPHLRSIYGNNNVVAAVSVLKNVKFWRSRSVRRAECLGWREIYGNSQKIRYRHDF